MPSKSSDGSFVLICIYCHCFMFWSCTTCSNTGTCTSHTVPIRWAKVGGWKKCIFHEQPWISRRKDWKNKFHTMVDELIEQLVSYQWLFTSVCRWDHVQLTLFYDCKSRVALLDTELEWMNKDIALTKMISNPTPTCLCTRTRNVYERVHTDEELETGWCSPI